MTMFPFPSSIIGLLAAAGPGLMLAHDPEPYELRQFVGLDRTKRRDRQKTLRRLQARYMEAPDPRTKGRRGAAARMAARKAFNAARGKS